MKRKHTLRSLLSMVCTIAMIISMVPVLPATAAADVFYDTMESYTVGTDLYTQAGDKYTKTSPAWGNANFTSESQGSVAVVADPVNSGNKVLAVTSAGQSKRYILTPAPKITGDYTLQFDYMPAKAVSNVGSGFLDIYINDGRNQIARINYRTYGSYFYLDGASASPMAKNSDINKDNTWYSVRVVVSEDEYTMDIWEKGAPDTMISTTATKNQKANAGSNVEFCFGPYDSAWGMDTSAPITNYIDNIRITPGVVEASISDSAAGGDDVAVSGGGMVNFVDAAKIVNKEAVAITAGMGIFNGKEGNTFDPTGVLTRAEMATVIVKMLRGNAFNADNFKGYNKFSDTADYQGGWAEGYINACVQMGVVAGYGDGTFKPGNSVTTAEALTMIINALGVDAGEGSWPDTIMVKAEAMKLYGDLSPKPGTYDALTRDQLAVLVYEGMCYSPSGVTGYKIPGVEIVFADIADAMKANNGVTGITEVIGEDALANKVYELKIAEGYIVTNQANSDNEYTVVRTVKDDGSYEDTQFNMETKLEEIGHYVTVYYREVYKNEKEPGVVYNYVDETQTVTVEEAISTSKDYKEAFTKSIKTAKRVAELDAAYDWQGTNTTLSGYTAGSIAKTGTYFIYEGEVVGYMPLVPEYAAKVRAVNKFDGNETIELSGVATPISNSEDNDRIVEHSGIKKDDFVTYVKVGSGANETYILTKVTTAKGTVEKTFTNEDGDDVITIKGVDYVEFGGTNNVTEFQSLPAVNYTDSYTLYVTADGEYIGYEKTEGGLDLNETVFILGELVVDVDDGYGGKVHKTTARGVDMTGKEVNFLLKVEKNGTVDANGNYFPSMDPADTIKAPTYKPLTPNTFYTYELSNDKDAKKEGIYVLEALPTAYNKDTAPVYTGTRTISDGSAYAFSNFTCNGKNTYYHGATVYMLLEGSLGQTTPLTAEVKKSWATSTNTSGAPMQHYYILSRNESDNQMLDVALVIAEDAMSAAGTQVVYVSEENRVPAGTNADGYVYDVYDYKTGAAKQITVKTTDSNLQTETINGVSTAGVIKEAGYWHTIPEADTSRSVLVSKVVDTAAFTGTTSNSSSNDKLYTENIAHDQVLVELANDELNTPTGTRLRKASSAIVVDVRSEEDITAAGIGKITNVDRLGTLAVDHPEVTVIFDLCYSSTSSKMHTIFIKDVYFTSVEGGSEIIENNGVYYLDGRVVASNVTITDASGRLVADPTNVTATLNELANATGIVNLTYTMNNGKVTDITITGILADDELFVENFAAYTVGDELDAGGPNFTYLATSYNKGTATVVDDGGSNALKVATTDRYWVQSVPSFSGNYAFESAFKIGAEQSGLTSFRLRNIGVPVTEDSTVPDNWKGVGYYSDYELRIAADGTLSVFANKHIPENNADAYGRLYPNGASGTALTITKDNWYKVKIIVDAVNKTVTTELYDATGTKLGYRTDSKIVVLEGPVTIDMQGAGQRWFDDMIVTKGAAIAPANTYTVTAERTDANGLISVDKTSAKAGDPVSVTTTAKAGYKLDQLLVNGTDILTQPGYNNDDLNTTVVTTFTMPAQNTTVTAKFAPISSYTVTVTQADSYGTVTADKTGSVKEGEVITITATAKDTSAYIVKSIKVNGEEIATSSPATYVMVDENADITAEFEIIPYYAVTTRSYSNGSLSLNGIKDGAGNFKKGADITVVATPNAGYKLSAIYVNGVKDEDGIFTLTEANTNVSATFKPENAVFFEGFDDIAADTNGLPEGFADYSGCGGTRSSKVVDDGVDRVLKITTTGSGTATNSRSWIKTTDTFNGSYTVEARFMHGGDVSIAALRLPAVDLPNTNGGVGDYELRLSTTGGAIFLSNPTDVNKVTGETNSLYLRDTEGDPVAVVPNVWHTVKVHVDSLAKTVTTELYTDSSATPVASRVLYDAVIAEGNVTFDHQTGANVTADKSRWACWDYVAVTPMVVPESDVTVATAPAGCTVLVNGETGLAGIKAGETVTITANYDADVYKAPTFTVTTETGGNVDVIDNKFTMPGENVNVTANFTAWVYSAVTATVSDDALGSIDGAPTADVKEGEFVTFSVTVNNADDYYVSGVTMNGEDLIAEADGSYKFQMPAQAANVVVTIVAKPTYAVTIDNTITNGNVVPDKFFAKVGETITLTVTAETGYETVSVSASGADVSKVDDTTYTFEMPAEAVTVTATFAREGLRIVDDFEGYTAGADLPVGDNNAFAAVETAFAGTGARKGVVTYTAEVEDSGNVLKLSTKKGGAGGNGPTAVWLTTKDTFGSGTITLKIKVDGYMDYAGVKLSGIGYELKFDGGSATVNGTAITGVTVTDKIWYTVEIVIDNGTAITNVKNANGSSTLGTSSTSISTGASAITIGMAAEAGAAATSTQMGYTYVDEIQVVTGN